MTNAQIEMVHDLTGEKKQITSLKNNKGKVYLKNTMDVFVEDTQGNRFYSSNSTTKGRSNTTRLGYYYYESHIRDLGFARTNVKVEGNKYDLSDFRPGSWMKNKDVKNLEYKKGTMEIVIENPSAPYIHKQGIYVDPSSYNAIEITLKTKGKSNTGSLYFFTEDTKSFNEKQRVDFIVKPDGKYHTYVIDIAGTGFFNSPLKAIRIDIGASKGEKITFKSIKAVKSETPMVPLKLDKTFHTYADKLHQEYRVIAALDYDNLANFGFEVKISKKSVSKIQFKDKNGTSSNIKKLDKSSVQYVAFDVKKVGVIGFIIPPDGSTSMCTITEDRNNYIFTQYATVNNSSLKSMGSITFGNRLYTDTTHSFKGIENATYIEYNPLEDITITEGGANGEYLWYVLSF